MKTQTVREQMQAIQEQIDTLNFRKAPLQKAFEEEQKRDPEFQKPWDLKDLNRELYELYEQRDTLLKNNPELQKEFGKFGGKKKQALPSYGFQTQSQRDEADRARRKKLIDPGFREWCMAQKPPIKFSLDNWENDKIHGMFKAEQESKARSVHEAEATRQANQEAADARMRIERQARIEAIPRDFLFFLVEMGESSAADDDELIAAYEDGDTKELYKLWSLERK